MLLFASRHQQWPDGVCHFHFARDVGKDLFEQPHQALSARLQALKLQLRLREQRKDQTDYLRKQLARGEATLLLQRLLSVEQVQPCWSASLGREVLLALHFWILDYAQDGSPRSAAANRSDPGRRGNQRTRPDNCRNRSCADRTFWPTCWGYVLRSPSRLTKGRAEFYLCCPTEFRSHRDYLGGGDRASRLRIVVQIRIPHASCCQGTVNGTPGK
jgi:hypothetical protein